MFRIFNQRDLNFAERRLSKEVGSNVVYIGRGSKLGNEAIIGKHGTRDEVIELYRMWLWNKIQVNDSEVKNELNRILDLESKFGHVNLVCHCKPLRCHGDVIINCLNYMKGD